MAGTDLYCFSALEQFLSMFSGPPLENIEDCKELWLCGSYISILSILEINHINIY